MRNEILEKIDVILSDVSLDESRVQHLFTLTRKLIEQLPPADRGKFALLRFYCDWTVHHKIDRSKEGAEILRGLHNILHSHIQTKDDTTLLAELTAALSLDIAHDQLNTLLAISDQTITNSVLTKSTWDQIVPKILEIVSNCTLSISAKTSSLGKILGYIRSRPLKGTSVVEELTIIKIPSTTFDPQAASNSITYCLMLNTSDTTKIVAPFVKSQLPVGVGA